MGKISHGAAAGKRSLTINSAVEIALLNNRALQATFNRLGVAEAIMAREQLPPNPTFSFSRLAGPLGRRSKARSSPIFSRSRPCRRARKSLRTIFVRRSLWRPHKRCDGLRGEPGLFARSARARCQLNLRGQPIDPSGRRARTAAWRDWRGEPPRSSQRSTFLGGNGDAAGERKVAGQQRTRTLDPSS